MHGFDPVPVKVGERLSYKQAYQNSLMAKYDKDLFGRTWTIVREVKLPPHQRWRNKFGSVGRHGWVLKADDNGELLVVGEHMLRLIADHYKGVMLPWRRRAPRNRFLH